MARWQPARPITALVDLQNPRSMRLSETDRQLIVQLVAEVAGASAQVQLFGSRLDDARRGGDIDLLVSVDEPVERPAVLVATLGARLERALGGRRVDVVLSAPNLRVLPIHQVARMSGVRL
jgi:predicted nucleotidyltransferase